MQLVVLTILVGALVHSWNKRAASCVSKSDWLMRRPYSEVEAALGKPWIKCETPAQFEEVTRTLATQSGKSHTDLPKARGQVWIYVTTNLPTRDGHLFVYFSEQGRVTRVSEVAW